MRSPSYAVALNIDVRSSAEWNHIRPKLEAEMIVIKRQRITMLAYRVYEQHKKDTGIVDDSAFVPSSAQIAQVKNWPSLLAAVEEDAERLAETFGSEHISLILTPLVINWATSRRGDLYAKVVAGGVDPLPEPVDDADLRRFLALATSVFSCSNGIRCINKTGNPRYADESLEQHQCLRNDMDCLRRGIECLDFDVETSETVAACVTLAGLDPRVATTVKMDELNARFYCVDCPMGADLARSWRNCVSLEI